VYVCTCMIVCSDNAQQTYFFAFSEERGHVVFFSFVGAHAERRMYMANVSSMELDRSFVLASTTGKSTTAAQSPQFVSC